MHLVGQVMGMAAALSADTLLVGTPQRAGQFHPAVPNTGCFGSLPTEYITGGFGAISPALG